MTMGTNMMMRNVFTLLVLAAVGLAACSGPALSGRSDSAQVSSSNGMPLPGVGFDNTANSLGGRFVGGGGGA
jgi:hypothetical protein